MTDWLLAFILWLNSLDGVTLFRIAYTWTAILGLPVALWCGWHSRSTWQAIQRAGINGGLKRASMGYRRRDLFRVVFLLATATVGVFALYTGSTQGGPIGLALLTGYAFRDAADALMDFRDRRADAHEGMRPPAAHEHTEAPGTYPVIHQQCGKTAFLTTTPPLLTTDLQDSTCRYMDGRPVIGGEVACGACHARLLGVKAEHGQWIAVSLPLTLGGE